MCSSILLGLFVALGCASALDMGAMLCRNVRRGSCISSNEECKGTAYPKIPCKTGTVCCNQRRRSNIARVTTMPTTPKPAILAANYAVLNCGRAYSSTEGAVERRILGGDEATPGQWPWLVSLRVGNRHMCGGSIINRQWILTAAHCFTRDKHATSWTVVAGEFNSSAVEGHEVRVGVNRIFKHGYDPLTKTNDVALLLLDKPLHDVENADDWINEICLPTPEDTVEAGMVCHLMGWGYLEVNDNQGSKTLQEITMPIVDRSLCVSEYNKTVDGEETFNPYIIDHTQICAGNLEGGMDSCQGDSGGPLTCQRNDGSYFVAGLTSYSLGCGYKGIPGVYTKTTAHLAWIESTIAENTVDADGATDGDPIDWHVERHGQTTFVDIVEEDGH